MLLNRRHLLFAGALAPSLLRAAPSGKPPRWVVVLLRGAVDGLSVCAPYAEAEYAAERPSIALQRPGLEGGLIDLDGRFGLHPALATLQPLWAAGQLGFVHACGAPGVGRSHFEAQDELEAGTPGVKTTPDGWMARLIGLRPETGAAQVQALYTGATRPKLFKGSGVGVQVAALPGANARRARSQAPALSDALERLYAQDPRYAQAWRDGQRGRDQVADALTASSAEMPSMDPKADGGAPLPAGFPETARRLARVMRADAGVQFACLELGGWDTHARQGAAQGQLAGRLAPLGQGLAVLAQELGPLWQDTVVTVISEFGRTVAENGNGGTDHGHGNVLWQLGGRVAGGRVLGDWPGLQRSARHEGRDLAITTDYRAVLSGIAAQHLGLNDAALAVLFPRFSGRPLAGLFSA